LPPVKLHCSSKLLII